MSPTFHLRFSRSLKRNTIVKNVLSIPSTYIVKYVPCMHVNECRNESLMGCRQCIIVSVFRICSVFISILWFIHVVIFLFFQYISLCSNWRCILSFNFPGTSDGRFRKYLTYTLQTYVIGKHYVDFHYKTRNNQHYTNMGSADFYNAWLV